MTTSRPAFALILSAVAVACANPRATVERAILGDPAKPYFGMTKDEVLACAGPPAARFSRTNGETLTYHYSGAGPVPPTDKGDKEEAKGFFAGRKSSKDWACNASLIFEGDRLVRVTFAPRDAVSPYAKERDPKTGKKVPVEQPEPCTFSLPNCPSR